jgi:hypothetical protein
MAQPIQTTLDVILSAVKAKLIAANVASASCVYLSLTPDFATMPLVPPGDQLLILVPGRQTVFQGAVRGGGNDALLFDNAILDIWLYCRLNTDENPRSDNWLTDPTLGAIPTMNTLIRTLQLWQPVDVNNNGLTYEPMRLLQIEQGRRLGGKAGTEAPGWASIVSSWQFRWWMLVS